MRTLYKGKNILIVIQREGNGPVVIQSSGYTSDEKATKEPWIVTQFRTIPHRDRRKLPDPVIFKTNLPCYKEIDANVLTLYLLPECESLEKAANELATWYTNSLKEKVTFVGHSKGGLLITSALEKIKKPTKACLICPTFGTITGDEESMVKKIEECKRKNNNPFFQLKLNGLKTIIKVTCSRRPVDKDMCEGSYFVEKTAENIEKIKGHNVILVTAHCPTDKCSLQDRIFKYVGQILGLNPEASDGMVELEKQRVPAVAIKTEYVVDATHPTVFKAANSMVKALLLK